MTPSTSAVTPSPSSTSAVTPSPSSTPAVTPSPSSTPTSTPTSTPASTPSVSDVTSPSTSTSPSPSPTPISAPAPAARPATNSSTLASPIAPTTDSNPITTYICAGVAGTALLAGIAFAMHVRSLHVHRAQLTQSKRVNILNPLNQTPVSVPWSSQEAPWKLGETMRAEFRPMHIRGMNS